MSSQRSVISDELIEQIKWCCKYLDQVLGLCKGGQLHKDLMHILSKIPVATKITIIGVHARRSAMIVSGTQVHVAF